MKRHEYVYFVRPVGMDGPVKIGCSGNPPERLSSLMVWSPYPLEIAVTIPGDRRLERVIQGHFIDLHSHREWFVSSPELSFLIQQLRAGAQIDDVIDLSGVTARLPHRRNYTDDHRNRMGYYMRCHHAAARVTRFADVPDDVYRIMRNWSAEKQPTSAEFELLNRYIAEPWPKQRRAA